jgi:hypothetical protein
MTMGQKLIERIPEVSSQPAKVPGSVWEGKRVDVPFDFEHPATKGRARSGAAPRVELGTLAGFDDSGSPLVTVSRRAKTRTVKALSVVSLAQCDLGRQAVLLWESGKTGRAIVLGLVQDPAPARVDAGRGQGPFGPKPSNFLVDGERLVITADREIVLQCGEASVTLTRAGRVIIRGKDLLSRSSGTNRIKGGSVQIN